jgi:hypothetical protein
LWGVHILFHHRPLTRCRLSRDDVEKVINNGKSFLNFCPQWKDSDLWEQWRQFGIQCFSDGMPLIALMAIYWPWLSCQCRPSCSRLHLDYQ